MKKVLLLGDSIRMGYQPLVKDLLDGKAEVWGPEDNCRFAHYTLWYLKAWLNEVGDVDVIHWNNGLWDGSRLASDDLFITASDYADTLARIIAEIKRQRPQTPIVFALTTPVIPGPNAIDNETINSFNDAAKGVMEKESVEINDLNAVLGQDESLFAPDLLHLSQKGNERVAQAVVAVLGKYI